ncbi:MAG: glycosyltransferase [Pseudonocardiales bacterium]|nr:glycosyltransferase [Pseudonocardiales bacterium]
MRVLVVSAPLAGHLLPLVPLAHALRDAGHEVHLAAGGEVPPSATTLPVHDLAPGFRLDRLAARVLSRHPLLLARELRGVAGTDGVRPMFGAVNARLVGPLLELAGRLRPDVVVHEPLAVAGAVAAARLGVPAVLQDNSLWDGAELVATTARDGRLRAAARREGVVRLPAPALRLVCAPPSVVGPRAGRLLRPVPWSGTGTLPGWLTHPGDRPRLLVSHSTIAGPGGAAHLRRVLDAAPRLDAEVVLVRPPARLDVPPTVRTTGWIPLTDALPHATAVVHHGGAGTALGALAAGIPQLLVPGPGDRRRNAELVAARGAGLALPARAITAGHLHRLLHDPALRAAAREVAAEIAGMPGPAEVAALLRRPV